MAGLAQQVSATSLKVKSFSIQAHESNVGNIYIGESAAGISSGARNVLSKQATAAFEVDTQYADDDNIFIDLTDVYVHGNSAGDIAIITYTEAVSYEY